LLFGFNASQIIPTSLPSERIVNNLLLAVFSLSGKSCAYCSVALLIDSCSLQLKATKSPGAIRLAGADFSG
jgi:hypothetical protein